MDSILLAAEKPHITEHTFCTDPCGRAEAWRRKTRSGKIAQLLHIRDAIQLSKGFFISVFADIVILVLCCARFTTASHALTFDELTVSKHFFGLLRTSSRVSCNVYATISENLFSR